MIREFFGTCYGLVVAGRFADLVEFLALTRLILTTPVATITPGKPVDKD